MVIVNTESRSMVSFQLPHNDSVCTTSRAQAHYTAADACMYGIILCHSETSYYFVHGKGRYLTKYTMCDEFHRGVEGGLQSTVAGAMQGATPTTSAKYL